MNLPFTDDDCNMFRRRYLQHIAVMQASSHDFKTALYHLLEDGPINRNQCTICRSTKRSYQAFRDQIRVEQDQLRIDMGYSNSLLPGELGTLEVPHSSVLACFGGLLEFYNHKFDRIELILGGKLTTVPVGFRKGEIRRIITILDGITSITTATSSQTELLMRLDHAIQNR